METKTPETFESRQAREKLENAKSRKETRAKLAETFKLAGFTILPEKNDSGMEAWGPDVRASGFFTDKTAMLSGLELFAEANCYHTRGRVRFSVRYPGSVSGEIPYDKEWPKPEATAALTKKPEQLAADVSRRILPDALRGLEMARKANAEVDAYRNGRGATLREILGRELTEGEEKEGRSRLDGINTGEAWGNVQAFKGAANMELHSLTTAQAVAIMKIIKQR